MSKQPATHGAQKSTWSLFPSRLLNSKETSTVYCPKQTEAQGNLVPTGRTSSDRVRGRCCHTVQGSEFPSSLDGTDSFPDPTVPFPAPARPPVCDGCHFRAHSRSSPSAGVSSDSAFYTGTDTFPSWKVAASLLISVAVITHTSENSQPATFTFWEVGSGEPSCVGCCGLRLAGAFCGF